MKPATRADKIQQEIPNYECSYFHTQPTLTQQEKKHPRSQDTSRPGGTVMLPFAQTIFPRGTGFIRFPLSDFRHF